MKLAMDVVVAYVIEDPKVMSMIQQSHSEERFDSLLRGEDYARRATDTESMPAS